MSFLDSYAALENLSNDIQFTDDKNCINSIVNDTTYSPIGDSEVKFLKKNFLISLSQSYSRNYTTKAHFYVNYLAHESCALFFKFLKDNHCWDNSRIIILGDHGSETIRKQTTKFVKQFETAGVTSEAYIPLLMAKDFNATGNLKIANTCMTLADIPRLITEGLNKKLQANPFSGISFKDSRNESVVKILTGGDWKVNKQKSYTQFKTALKNWVYLKENMYDPKCRSKDNFGEEK